jgi:hypothetical protein
VGRPFGAVHAFTAYQQVFFERGQFRSIGDQAQVVALKISVGKVFHGGIVGERAGMISLFFQKGCVPKDAGVAAKTRQSARMASSEIAFEENFRSAMSLLFHTETRFLGHNRPACN